MSNIEDDRVFLADDQASTVAISQGPQIHKEIDSLTIHLQFLLPAHSDLPAEFEEKVRRLQCRVSLSPCSNPNFVICGIGGLSMDLFVNAIGVFLNDVVFRGALEAVVTLLLPDEFELPSSPFVAKVYTRGTHENMQLVGIEGGWFNVLLVCERLTREIFTWCQNKALKTHETYQLLRRYNALLLEFLTHFTQSEVVTRIDDDVRTIQVELTQKKNCSLTDIADLDPTDPSNAIAVFVYIATTINWSQCITNVREGNVAVYGRGDTFMKFCTNLETLNSHRTEQILLSTDVPLLNRILLCSVIANFYMRAEEACYTLPLSYYMDYQAAAPEPIPDANWEFFSRISGTRIILSAFQSIDHEAPWSEVLSSLQTHVYSASLRQLHGISCFESYIFIDKQHIANVPEFIIVLLHELAHSGKRYPKRLDYFKSSPLRYIDEEHRVTVQEDGQYMEKLVFGGKVGDLYPGTNDFLCALGNWSLDPAIFAQEVQRLQEEGAKKGRPMANLLMPRHSQRVCGWSFK